MESVTPEVGGEAASEAILECLGESPNEVKVVEPGMIAATFECVVGSDSYIVQFNEPNMAGGAQKERLLSKRLAESRVPIRDLVCIGEHGDLIYTVARRAVGTELTKLSAAEFEAALPSVFEVLVSLSQIDLSDTDGFGWFDRNGHGHSETWVEHLLHVWEEEPGLFYDRWHVLFETTFLERERFQRYIERMTGLLATFGAPRQLVHGGFGYDNILVQNNAVTAVLDWQDARFGDGLFDLAYMHFWPSGFDLPALYESYCAAIGVCHECYSERIACYNYYHAADAMRFFAKTDNRAAYESVIELAEKIEG